MAPNGKPRIKGDAIISLGTKFLDSESPTSQDWRVLASLLGFPDTWIQKNESVCLPTGKSPTVRVLRAWQERFRVTEDLPVHEKLVGCLRWMKRIDAASWVEQTMEEGTFLDSPNGLSGCCYSCQAGQHSSQTNDSTRSKKSAQENSYYGLDSSLPSQCDPERCNDCKRRMKSPICSYEHQLTTQTYHQPHQPRNGQSVVSLHSDVSDKSDFLPMPSQWNNTKTWPFKKGEVMNSSAQDRYLSPSSVSNRGEIQHHFRPMERESPNYRRQDDDSRPFHSLVSTTSVDVHHHRGDHRVCAAYGPCSHGTVDHMMMDYPTQASPNQTLKRDSMLITYAYKNYKTAHNLAKLLFDQGHQVKVDTKEQIEVSTFTSVNFVIIIFTQDYLKEVYGIVEPCLNTRFIWDLMAEEYNRRENTNLRFVPIFDHARIDRTSIPCFLRSYSKEKVRYICDILTVPKPTTPKHGEISIQRRVY